MANKKTGTHSSADTSPVQCSLLIPLLKGSTAKSPFIKLGPFIVMIDSITWSFCLRHCVQNGLSYPGKETRPTLCLQTPSVQNQSQRSRTNKHQLLH